MPRRIGKAVSQEEVAEAVGISREWYSLIERDRLGGVSASVLARIADALMMEPAERAAFFRLAVPELATSSLTDRSSVILEAFASLRRLTRRLWAATTEAEALTVVREYAITQLAADCTMTTTRHEGGYWDYAATCSDDHEGVMRFHARLRERWGRTVIDDLNGYPLLARPGEVLTRSERNALLPDLDGKVRGMWSTDVRVQPTDVSFLMARVRSKQGLVATLYASHHKAYAYSKLDRAQLSTLADLASHALSGHVSIKQLSHSDQSGLRLPRPI